MSTDIKTRIYKGKETEIICTERWCLQTYIHVCTKERKAAERTVNRKKELDHFTFWRHSVNDVTS